jgi:hypothetical protein
MKNRNKEIGVSKKKQRNWQQRGMVRKYAHTHGNDISTFERKISPLRNACALCSLSLEVCWVYPNFNPLTCFIIQQSHRVKKKDNTCFQIFFVCFMYIPKSKNIMQVIYH